MNAANRLQVIVKDGGKEVFNQEFAEFPLLFGRDEHCQIRLEGSSFISRVHGSIAVLDGAIVVIDLNSHNGFCHKGKKAKHLRIRENCTITIGTMEFILSFAQPAQPDRWLDQSVQQVMFDQVQCDDLELQVS